ncbi:MAG: HAMP domain-containing sensor histidine kinase, partial [Thermoanaerobaculia bacterium]
LPPSGTEPQNLRNPGVLIVQLDDDAIRSSWLADLSSRIFPAADEAPVDVAVIRKGSAGPEIFFTNSASPQPLLANPMVRRPLFGPREGPGPAAVESGASSYGHRFGRGRRGEGFGPDSRGPGLQLYQPWELVASYRAGSLEQVVDATRKRNLAISAGIVLLLVLTVLLIIDSARRRHKLAQQQIEFIAGVTHELNTPLAAIRSAGQNLADGIVTGEEQVRRYGSMIVGEGRRLSTMVAEVLEFAGMTAPRRAAAKKTVGVASLVQSAVADSKPFVDEQNASVTLSFPEDLPPVTVNESAVRRALTNLVVNAAKHGRPGVSIGIRGWTAAGRVMISVADDGPGIDRRDLPHLFEPFYRGRGTEQSRGSGLGLSLVRRIVEAENGTVRVESSGRGSTFTVSLPTAGAPAPRLAGEAT